MHGCSWAKGGLQSVDDMNREEADPGWRRVLLLVGSNLSAQTKFDLSHPVMTWVVGPY